MYTSLLLATAFSGFVTAQTTTTVPYFGPDWNIEIPRYTSTGASVSDINALATTYVVSCLSGAPTTECDINTPWTIVQGPGTMSYTAVYTAWLDGGVNGVTATESFECSFTSYSTSPSCSMSYEVTGTTGGVSYSTSTSSTGSVTGTYYGLDVTGGLASFTAPQATSTPGVAAAGPARALITAAPLAAAALAAML
jgi:hypothetical protein